jgi:pimeloyl-ACP methyl ester carboxylesterase
MTAHNMALDTPATDERPSWLPREEWPFELRFVDVDGHRVHYVDEGKGPTLLFVHAGFWSFVWRDLIEEMRSDFRCVALDFPGHGLSEAASGYRVGLESHGAVLAGFVEALELREFTLVAHDLGGPIGITFAGEHPELVRALAPVNTFAWRPEAFGLKVMMGMVGSRPMQLFGGLTNLVPRASAGNFGVGRLLSDAGKRAFLGPFRRRHARRNFHRLMRDGKRSGALMDRAEQALRGPLAGRPMLLVYGEKNDPYDYRGTFKGMFPHAAEYVVEDGNHFPMCNDPAGVAAALREWWRTSEA